MKFAIGHGVGAEGFLFVFQPADTRQVIGSTTKYAARCECGRPARMVEMQARRPRSR